MEKKQPNCELEKLCPFLKEITKPEILSRLMAGKGGRTATVSRPVLRRPSSLSAQDHPHP